MKRKYDSFEEYSERNPDRNKRFDDVVKYAIKTQGYVEITNIKFRDSTDIKKFLRTLEEAYERTKKSRLIFKIQEI